MFRLFFCDGRFQAASIGSCSSLPFGRPHSQTEMAQVLQPEYTDPSPGPHRLQMLVCDGCMSLTLADDGPCHSNGTEPPLGAQPSAEEPSRLDPTTGRVGDHGA